MAQKDKEKPKFFPFEERDAHDMDKLARKLYGIKCIEVDKTLYNEYIRKDRYWDTIYPSYELFKQQYDACVNRILKFTKT